MARLILHSAFILAAITTSVLAQGQACSASQQCPQETPCCSQYGQCGVGAYCLGGCDPVSSFSLDSCMPAPVCESKSFTWNNLDGVEANTKYLGDASKADWVSSGQPLSYQNQLWLTMSEGSVGTLLRSSHYMWYGKATASLKTSAGAGVVTAFILLGDSKDEIDFEFVGVELESAQTNFYSLGVTNYTNGQNITGLSDVHANFHTYEIDWQPDSITWSIDGNSVRTLNRDDTFNATTNRYDYPQTPAQLQLSLWPGGLASNGEGTIQWAGGLVQWNSPYMVNGYYYAAFESVNMECYKPPTGANQQGSKSYIYTDDSMANSSIEISNNDTILASFLNSGLDPGNGSATSSASGSAKTSNVATVPGLSGSGTGSDGQRGSNGSSSSGSGSGSGSGSSSASASGSASTGFVQGDGGSSGAAQIGGNNEKVLQGSLLAVVIAIVGLCVL